ncbi:unnamed protein product [Discula destructiva]
MSSYKAIWLLSVLAIFSRIQIPPSVDGVRSSAQALPFDALPSLLDATLTELSTGLESGDFTSADLVRAYIARIEETNAQLHAVTEINPDALAIAEALDAARQDGHVYSPLHGIPVLVKNNIATADRMNTTAGSYALLGAKVSEDSTAVAKLRKAGAIILGKANLSQWSDGRSRNTSSGWSAHGGQTLGAYHEDQDACGSSSGSGVGASIGLSWATLGTETSGSIQCPASFNNVVGIKPTVGLTSRYLVVPLSEHQDTVGPLARTVKDAAYLLNAIAGPDKHDNYTSAIPFQDDQLPDYVAACQLSALAGKRIGIPRHVIAPEGVFYTFSPEALESLVASFNNTVEIIQAAGAEIVDDIFLPGWDALVKGRYMSYTIGADMLSDMPKYLSKLTTNPHNVTSLHDLRAFTRSHGLEGWPERDTELFDVVLDSGIDNTSPLYWSNRTLGLFLSGPQGILGAIKNHSLDAIVLPAYHAMSPPAMIGSPAVTVPMGAFPPSTPVAHNHFGTQVAFGPNIPFGISFLGDLFSEEALVGMAYAFEQKTMIRAGIKPLVQPTTELRDVIRNSLEFDEEQEL